ncbi:Bax inhibitor-1/YccA family protein [Caulobacter sp. 602-1]|uniref:Bax inhibitor-1/YccA family protein n=1 Tax=Caulobacter sp. 602-1 TaxID=2492472 RepID=UPI000F636C61|nr:Bax inhibitor-1/YccA family protein [Caulobacter sp. 602-1]RRN64022.1 Bax inhibitor-1/YccA family protein [Caulobacter sp. 602-1]
MPRRGDDLDLGAALSVPPDRATDFMASVWAWMAGGVLISAAAAWSAAYLPAVSRALFTDQGLTGVGWMVTLAPLLIVLPLSASITRLSPAVAAMMFLSYAALVGLSLGGLVMAYSGHDLALALVCVAAGFGVMAALGAVTRIDLGGLGVFMTMSVVTLLLAMVANLFLRSSPLDLAICAMGALIFAGLTAFDVQRLRRLAAEGWNGAPRPAVMGGLTLYLDLLNLFLFALRLTGRRR